MLDLSSNVASNRKMDRSGVSGKYILGGIDTKFVYYRPSRSKVDENLRGGISRSSDLMPLIFKKHLLMC